MHHIGADCLITHGADQFGARPGCPVLRLDGRPTQDWPAHALEFIDRHVKWGNQPLGLVFGGTEQPYEQQLAALIEDHYRRAEVQQKTVQRFAVEWARNFCHTLIRAPRWATSLDQPWTGRPAFVVAAGPSLDINGHLLRECQKRGPIMAVNTSLPACLHYGVTPDIVLCSEAVNVASHLARSEGVPVALDAVAGQENWDAATDPLAIAWSEPNLIPYVLACGAIPLNYRGSVACGAVALALLWGASPIVLIGQDCAYTDMRVYAKGTEWADMRAELVNRGTALRFHGGKQGTDKELSPMPLVWRDGWAGSERVPSSHDMELLVQWFSRAADRHYVINASEGGAHLEGCYERPLADVIASMPEREREPIPMPEPCDTSALREKLCKRAERFLAEDDVMPPHDFPIINMWAVPALLETQRDPLLRASKVRTAMEQGCMEMMEILGA